MGLLSVRTVRASHHQQGRRDMDTKISGSERMRQQFYPELMPHTDADFEAARAFFAVTNETWFRIEGKLSINREEVTGERYDITQGGWAFL